MLFVRKIRRFANDYKENMSVKKYQIVYGNCTESAEHAITIEKGKIHIISKNGKLYLEIEVPENSWNSFNRAIFFGDYFCIGCGDVVYFVNLDDLTVKEVAQDMYFGYFYEYHNRLFIASGTSLSCYDENCNMIWKTDMIAVDGVIVNEIDEEKIEVSCEMDPPGGWCEKVISYESGKEIS